MMAFTLTSVGSSHTRFTAAESSSNFLRMRSQRLSKSEHERDQQPAASSRAEALRTGQDSQSPAREPEGDERSISYSRGSRNSIFISIPNRPIGTIGILTPFCLPAASCLPPAFPQLPCPLHGRIRLLKSHWCATFLQRFYHPSGHPRLYDSRRRYVFPPSI